MRFIDYSDNTEEDSRQGTIQICVNNAWGSVCNDDFFDNTDAAVFCEQLAGFIQDGIDIFYFCEEFYSFFHSQVQGNIQLQLQPPALVPFSLVPYTALRQTIHCFTTVNTIHLV